VEIKLLLFKTLAKTQRVNILDFTFMENDCKENYP